MLRPSSIGTSLSSPYVIERSTASRSSSRFVNRSTTWSEALLEALRCADIAPVRVKSIEQQALQSLHRTRSLWMTTRTSRINALRGFGREFGIAISAGSRVGVEQMARVLADPRSAIPPLLRETLPLLIEEIRLLEARIARLESQLTAAARESHSCATLLSVPGIGLLTATALVAATGGSVAHFKSARHFASWFGLTPKESSSGSTRHLGRISKRGDRYLRMLLTYGARSVLRAAHVAQSAGHSSDGLRQWALDVQCAATTTKPRVRSPTNWRASVTPRCVTRSPSPARRLEHKISRQAFPMPA